MPAARPVFPTDRAVQLQAVRLQAVQLQAVQLQAVQLQAVQAASARCCASQPTARRARSCEHYLGLVAQRVFRN